MSASYCPVCGSSATPHDRACRVCSFDLSASPVGVPQDAGQGSSKCGRCGSGIPGGSGYCQVCGLAMSTRRARIDTVRLNVRTLVRGGGGGGAQPPGPSASNYPGASGPLPATGGGIASPNDPTPLPGMSPLHPAARTPGNDVTALPQQAPDYGRQAPASAAPFVAAPPSQVKTAAELDHPARPVAAHAAAAPPQQAHAENLQAPNAPTMFSMNPNVASAPAVASTPQAAVPASPARVPAPAAAVPAYNQGVAGQPAPANYNFPDKTPVPVAINHAQPAAATPQRAAPVQRPSGPAPAAGRGPEMLIVRRDGSEGEAFSLAGGQLTIGRSEGEVRFPTDTFITRVHARLVLRENGVELVDLNSRNGVFVRILSPQQVYPGDYFLLGHQFMRLDNLDEKDRDEPTDADGVRAFGTPVTPAWGKLVSIGVGGSPSDVHYMRGAQTMFGRENGDVLYPSDNFMSRRHARLRMEMRQGAMSVVLEDMGSANGTYLRLRGSAVLGENDMFRVGDQLFRVRGLG